MANNKMKHLVYPFILKQKKNRLWISKTGYLSAFVMHFGNLLPNTLLLITNTNIF